MYMLFGSVLYIIFPVFTIQVNLIMPQFISLSRIRDLGVMFAGRLYHPTTSVPLLQWYIPDQSHYNGN